MKKPNFTVIRESGRTNFYDDRDYYDILSSIGGEYGSAGGHWDRPNMLLMNGKVVVESGLADIAWEWSKRTREIYDSAGKTVREEFKPEWLE